MQTDRADLFITDPPYNIGFAAQRNKETYKDTDDNLQGDEYLSLISGAYYNAMEHAEKGIVTCGKQNLTLWANNFEIDEIGVWIAKNKMSGGKVSNLSLWEPVLFFGKFDRKARVNDLFEYSTKFQPEADDHPCPKILELWEEFIKCYSSEIVIDTFLGSGTSIVACQNLQRRCRAIEISAAYVSVALERMSAAFPDLPITRLDVTPK
jgi:DNA modification methylase